jgi:hypothetical protein
MTIVVQSGPTVRHDVGEQADVDREYARLACARRPIMYIGRLPTGTQWRQRCMARAVS